MRKIRALGGEPQLAMTLLLVCGPVLLGLWFLLFSAASSFGGFIASIASHPADEPWAILMLLIWMGMVIPSQSASSEEGEEVPTGNYPTTMLWFAAIGIMIGLTAAQSEFDTPAGLNRNIAAYVAIAGAALHFLVAWTRPSAETIGRIASGTLTLCFIGWLLYFWLIEGEGGKALFFGLFVAAIWAAMHFGERKAEEVDYRHH